MSDIWQRNPKRCLFSPSCQGQPIQAHTVPRNILKTIQVDNHVIRLAGTPSTDASGNPSQTVEAQTIGINKASTGPFVCKYHEDLFKEIETPEADIHDNHVLDLMMYRASLLELWKLLRVTEPLSKWATPSVPPPIQPSNKLRAATDLANRLGPRFDPDVRNQRPAIEIKHLVKTIKTTTPIFAAAQANSSTDVAIHNRTGNTLPIEQTRPVTGREPNCSWSLTVIPRTGHHAVITSYVAGSDAEKYFAHITAANGAELEAAISAEIILFSENWYLNPSVWKAYGHTRRAAILAAYDNFEELVTGQYYYGLNPPPIPWYEFYRIPNRRQLNLFRF